MIIVKSNNELMEIIAVEKIAGKTIGFVPTMGYLHEGHGSLITKAKETSNYVVLSIFVNPLQFGPNEDFEKYPRDFERDRNYAELLGVDLLYIPPVREIYPTYPALTKVRVDRLTEVLCGSSRPGHFDGVTTIVNKLFNLVQPTYAYFGLKDAQQVAVVTQMVKDLNMNVTIVPCPIVREQDGLAKSSRNVYLDEEERKQAVILFKSLNMAQNLLKNGVRKPSILVEKIIDQIETSPRAVIDYVQVLTYPNLEKVSLLQPGDQIIIALAVKFGNTRLIDNCIVEIGS